MLRQAAHQLHRWIARAPAPVAGAYLSTVSLVCRHLLPAAASDRVRNSVCSVEAWPPLDFRPRRVTVGAGTRIRLQPHLGEFDGAALFSRRLAYEAPVFAWLEREAARRYGAVIEIGANVGVYSVFFDRLSRLPGARLKTIAVFEPSAEAFRRLLNNLALNGAGRVVAYNAAVAQASGFCRFFEPSGHLTNGSLIQSFSEVFSDRVEEMTVVAVAASELERFLAPSGRTLVKIDVEGFEPELLRAMQPLIVRRRPDLLIEVLPESVAAIDGCEALAGYARSLITDEGLQPFDQLHAHPTHRDWLLNWPSPV